MEKSAGVTPDRLIEGEDKSGAFEGKKHNEDPQAVRQVLIKAYKSNLEHKIDTEVASTSAPATAFADKGMYSSKRSISSVCDTKGNLFSELLD